MKGSRDVFKEAEELAAKRAQRQAGGGGGGGGKGAGGSGGGGQSPCDACHCDVAKKCLALLLTPSHVAGDWWEWGRSWGGQFWRGVLAFVKGMATILLFLGFLCGVSLWKPIFNALGHLVWQ